MPATQKRHRGQPHKVLHLSSYQRLEAYLRAFAQGHFHLLILVGAGGLAKSRLVREALNGKATSSSSSTTSMPSTPTVEGSACSSACARPKRKRPSLGTRTRAAWSGRASRASSPRRAASSSS